MGMLSWLWQRWKRVARVIANVQARLILMVFYFVVLLPFACGFQILSPRSRAKLPEHKGSHWLPKEPRSLDIWQAAQRQS
jgi:hypothetical protein